MTVLLTQSSLDFYKKCNRLLTLDDLLTVAEIPEANRTKAEKTRRKEKKDILLWYFDSWLPACAGIEHYSPTVRYYKRATHGTIVAPPDTKVALVPIESEAFGRLILENCEGKWKHVVPKKAADPTWSMPKDNKKDPKVHKYHVTKWSDGNNGQVKIGGWKNEAIQKFGDHTKSIEEFRNEERDKKGGKSFYAVGLKLMRDEHGISDEKYCGGKKRKRGVSLEPKIKVMPQLPAVTDHFSDEEEDDFTVHTDGKEAQDGDGDEGDDGDGDE